MGFLFLFKFAENACGVVQVVLNGSHSNTFDKNRYLGRRVMGAGGGCGGGMVMGEKAGTYFFEFYLQGLAQPPVR